MFNPTQVLIKLCVERLKAGYHQTYGSLKPDYAHFLGWAGTIALETIANSDALYHNVEHTVLVTLVGQEVLRGKHIREGNVSCEDWLQLIVSWLCHDIGYVKGVCRQDQVAERLYATGLEDILISLPSESTDASLAPFHVDRGKRFVEEYFSDRNLIDTQSIQRNIEFTRFPVLTDEQYSDTVSYPGLVRAADLIGQLADPGYLRKMPALFYEFEETGANKSLGYLTPDDLRKNYPAFFWTSVYPYIQTALYYLETTIEGKQIVANLYANVFRVEHEYGAHRPQ